MCSSVNFIGKTILFRRPGGKSDVVTFRRAIWSGKTGLAITRMSGWRSGVRLEECLRVNTYRSRRASRTRETGSSTAGLHGTKTSPLDRRDVANNRAQSVLSRDFILRLSQDL